MHYSLLVIIYYFVDFNLLLIIGMGSGEDLEIGNDYLI